MPKPLTWDSMSISWDMPDLTWYGAILNLNPNYRTMASATRFVIEITAEKKAAIEAAVAALKTELEGIIINLTKEERQVLPKIADKTLAFDEKCKAYMASRPELIPGFVDMDEMAKDRALVDDLLPCLREIAPICEGLEDTISLASTDIYVADLAFHQSVKQAAKRCVAGTDTIYDDLRERFPGRPRTTPPPETP